MSEQVPVLLTRDSFWKEHVKRAQVFQGSDLEYCRKHDLKPSTFSGYKRKFGFVKSPKPRFKPSRPSAFKKVSVTKSNDINVKSPEWVARFLKEFLT